MERLVAQWSRSVTFASRFINFKEQRRSKVPKYTVQRDFRATVQPEETRRRNTHI